MQLLLAPDRDRPRAAVRDRLSRRGDPGRRSGRPVDSRRADRRHEESRRAETREGDDAEGLLRRQRAARAGAGRLVAGGRIPLGRPRAGGRRSTGGGCQRSRKRSACRRAASGRRVARRRRGAGRQCGVVVPGGRAAGRVAGERPAASGLRAGDDRRGLSRRRVLPRRLGGPRARADDVRRRPRASVGLEGVGLPLDQVDRRRGAGGRGGGQRDGPGHGRHPERRRAAASAHLHGDHHRAAGAGPEAAGTVPVRPVQAESALLAGDRLLDSDRLRPGGRTVANRRPDQRELVAGGALAGRPARSGRGRLQRLPVRSG